MHNISQGRVKPALHVEQRPSRLVLAAIVVTVALAAGAALYFLADLGSREVVTLATRVGSAASASELSNRQTSAVPASTVGLALSPDVPAAETRAQELDRWIASGKPEDAQAAFRAIDACVTARRMEPLLAAETDESLKAVYTRNFPSRREACEGVTGGQATQRLPLAIRAAQAGVPGSYADFWGLGAHDELVQRDAAYVAAFPSIRDTAVERADKDALMSRFQYLSNCSEPPRCENVDLAQALTLWTAYAEVAGLKQDKDKVTARLTDKMPPEQSAPAIAAGHALVARARATKPN